MYLHISSTFQCIFQFAFLQLFKSILSVHSTENRAFFTKGQVQFFTKGQFFFIVTILNISL